MEDITSRPKLLAAVGRMTPHARLTKIVPALTHEAASQIKALIANVRQGLRHIRATAPQLTSTERWPALVRYIVDRVVAH